MDELTIEPLQVHEMMQRGARFLLLDCREPWEYEAASIAGSVLIPMRSIPQNLDKIPSDRPVVVICHSGMRSLDVALWLRRQGFRAQSLSGGIDQWSQEIDPNVPRY